MAQETSQETSPLVEVDETSGRDSFDREDAEWEKVMKEHAGPGSVAGMSEAAVAEAVAAAAPGVPPPQEYGKSMVAVAAGGSRCTSPA